MQQRRGGAERDDAALDDEPVRVLLGAIASQHGLAEPWVAKTARVLGHCRVRSRGDLRRMDASILPTRMRALLAEHIGGSGGSGSSEGDGTGEGSGEARLAYGEQQRRSGSGSGSGSSSRSSGSSVPRSGGGSGSATAGSAAGTVGRRPGVTDTSSSSSSSSSSSAPRVARRAPSALVARARQIRDTIVWLSRLGCAGLDEHDQLRVSMVNGMSMFVVLPMLAYGFAAAALGQYMLATLTVFVACYNLVVLVLNHYRLYVVAAMLGCAQFLCVIVLFDLILGPEGGSGFAVYPVSVFISLALPGTHTLHRIVMLALVFCVRALGYAGPVTTLRLNLSPDSVRLIGMSNNFLTMLVVMVWVNMYLGGQVERLRRLIGQSRAAIETMNVIEDELERACIEAQTLAESKSQFLATMSHEIRTPLHAIVAIADQLHDAPLSDEHRMYMTLLQRSADALGILVDDILDLSRMERGELTLRSEPMSPFWVVEEATRLMAMFAQARGLTLVQSFDVSVPDRVMGDASRLKQVLLNLLSNAVKFTTQGWISVHVHARDHTRLVVSVSDTGCGIPGEKLATIFSPFAQVDASSTRAHGGAGLGLTICMQIAKLMRGELGVQSSVGEGTTFTLELPLVLAPAPAPTAAPLRAPSAGAQRRRVPARC
jgi:signal transduction histidine kinase